MQQPYEEHEHDEPKGQEDEDGSDLATASRACHWFHFICDKARINRLDTGNRFLAVLLEPDGKVI
jgi:hypothetical protein